MVTSGRATNSLWRLVNCWHFTVPRYNPLACQWELVSYHQVPLCKALQPLKRSHASHCSPTQHNRVALSHLVIGRTFVAALCKPVEACFYFVIKRRWLMNPNKGYLCKLQVLLGSRFGSPCVYSIAKIMLIIFMRKKCFCFWDSVPHIFLQLMCLKIWYFKK